MPRPTLLCIFLCLLLLLPTWADPTDDAAIGACYMGYGKMLEAARSRQLSLNAHVERFLYQPGGLEIAYQGSMKDGGAVTHFIRLVGVKKGTTTSLVSTLNHADTDADQSGIDEDSYELSGWSGDGRYLLLNQSHWVENGNYLSQQFTCVDVGVLPPHIVPIPLPQPEAITKGNSLLSIQWWWSPDRSQIAFSLPEMVTEEDHHFIREDYCQIYDLKTGNLKAVTLGEKQRVRGWLDGGHLLFNDSRTYREFQPNPKATYASYDIMAGTQSTIASPKTLPTLPNGLSENATAVSPKASYMTLDDEPHHIQDQQKVGAVDAHALWVRRTQGPKLMSAAPVGLTPGPDDTQGVWAPTGNQIAFVAHGDLFVTDLTLRDATAVEKYAAGEKLTCPEEKELAMNNLKQVGLGLLQYSQDFDEQFPPADHWQDRVMPYVKNAAVFSPAGHPVIYRTPANLSLASIDNVADTVLGYIDLPCATVTLYVDGHVKALPKPGTGN